MLLTRNFLTKMIGAKCSTKMIAHGNFQLSHQNDRASSGTKLPTKMIEQNDRLTVPHHTHYYYHTPTQAMYVAGLCWFLTNRIKVTFHFERTHSSETKLISVPLRLPAGRRSKRPTIPDFEFVQSEGQRAPISSRKGTVSVLGLLSAAWQRFYRSETVC